MGSEGLPLIKSVGILIPIFESFPKVEFSIDVHFEFPSSVSSYQIRVFIILDLDFDS